MSAPAERWNEPSGVRLHLPLPACAHCGLEVPAGRIEPDAARQFCCDGCSTVFALLRSSELEDYYQVRDRLGGKREAAIVTQRTYEDFDDEALQALVVTRGPAGDSRVRFHLEGLHCGACVWLVEKVCQKVPGVLEARVDLGRQQLSLVYTAEALKLSTLAKRLDRFGYPCHVNVGDPADSAAREQDKKLLIRMGVAAAAAGNAMLMAFALYSGLAQGVDREIWTLFRWGSLLVTVPAVLWCGSVFFQRAWMALRARTPHMDIPISLGILAGFIWGAVNAVRGSGEIYFDTLGVLTFLLLVGRYIQQRSQRRSLDDAALLQSLAPSSARVETEAGTREMPIGAIPVGAVVVVQAGEVLPVDGVVLTGSSTLNVALLTGESMPEEVGEGQSVFAGTLNLQSELRIRASASGQSTRVGQLVKSLEHSALLRPKIALLADRVAAYFVVLVTALAAFTVWLWWSTSPERAVENAIALLVVSCPCALAMATPLAISSALGRAARAGILIKSGEAVERLAQAEEVVFDKTGTLTGGQLGLAGWCGDESLKTWVQALEAHSTHPVGRALAAHLPRDPDVQVCDAKATLGSGIEGTVNGRNVRVGKLTFALGNAGLPEFALNFAEASRRLGRSLVAVSVDGAVAAVASLEDPLRKDAQDCLTKLQGFGLKLAVLSGDQQSVVQSVAQALGNPFADVRGEVSPEGKRDALALRASGGHVVMVGDGVNDAGALAAASVGVAVHGGAEASLKVADVYVTKEGLGPLVQLFRGARRTLAVIRRGMAFSLFYNAISIVLAMTGHLNPLIAAILMPLSSITVIFNAYRSRTF